MDELEEQRLSPSPPEAVPPCIAEEVGIGTFMGRTGLGETRAAVAGCPGTTLTMVMLGLCPNEPTTSSRWHRR